MVMHHATALTSLRFRFAAQTRITPTCHIWTSTTNDVGRPAIGVPAVLIGKARMMQGSHVAWFLHYGVWPTQQLNHTSCDNGLCVRWDHLYEGTPAQNGADFAARQTATYCRSGLHLRTVANTRIKPNGTRLCRECKCIADAAWRLSRRL
jgi:hypothetical protein